ncbi:YcjX family protein [Hydrogenimonas thermophila]|uniref:YcjX-like protein n=1 Tax=Hydrogenimonas thermophila TaxID=223786 RepID=A0A1I5KVC8_9BACT|nr:YcjX family protein [Hydrogenimonas thermophila]SFO88381.1 hypothetical protein SAMN05216234_10186 [Hydrogenimonas thermophila]
MFKNGFTKFNDKIETIIKSAKESMNDLSIPIRTKKIAITGLSRSGKTIFITSLIEQLLHQKKIDFVTSKHNTFKVSLLPPKPSVKRFDYYTFSKDIKINHKWPDGTDSISSITLEFESKSSFPMQGNSKFRIELIDYPGEWILDLALLQMSFDEWSKKVIDWLKSIDEELAIDYLKEIEELTDKSFGKEIEEKIHFKYANMIMFFKKKSYSNLTPGRFLMPADLADDPLLIFAPIYKSNSPLYHAFKERYETYLNDVVKDIQLEYFKGFDRQIVLIDVVKALQNGPKCYEDMKTGLRSMLSIYEHKDKNFILQWFTPSIKKVTFVATKADLVASSQHNNYLSLLNEMVEGIRKDLDINHIKTDTFVVASVKSTQTVMGKYNGKTLSCVRGIDAKENRLVEIYPGEMPSSFPSPDQWDTENYAYEEFLPPKKSYKDDEPFDHINMDRVIESIIGDLL